MVTFMPSSTSYNNRNIFKVRHDLRCAQRSFSPEQLLLLYLLIFYKTNQHQVGHGLLQVVNTEASVLKYFNCTAESIS